MPISSKNKYLIVIAGPTAVGKTDLSIELAKHYNTVIISADSRQFYKQMTIGTAKPSLEQLQTVPHYFINTKNIDELYGAGHFEKDVITLLDEIFKENDCVIMVGGSGMYIDAVLYGVDDFEEVPINIREQLNQEYKEKGITFIQQKLKELDPEYYEMIDIQNPQRIIRGIEVSLYTGKPFSSFLRKKEKSRSFIPIKLLINTKREELYDRINKRVDAMMKDGLLDEVKTLLPYKDLNALKTVGYKELFDHLDGKISLEFAVNKIKQHTRNYAKRQITWFKNQDEFEEFGPDDLDKIIAYIDIIKEHG